MNQGIIIQNGLVIDPETSTISKKEIGIVNGVFTAVEGVAQAGGEVQYIDATNHYVAPGFIDLHAHVFEDYTELGIEPDLVGIDQGVTTIVDAGSAGYENYPLFKETVIEKEQDRNIGLFKPVTKGLM
jgi:dihydroorotase